MSDDQEVVDQGSHAKQLRDKLKELDPTAALISMIAEMEDRLQDQEEARVYDPASDDDMLDFAEHELGVKIRTVPVVKSIFLDIIHDARAKRIIRDAILGPRGGGKTRLAATIVLVLYRFFGYDVQNVGGSLKQAKACYGYVTDGHDRTPVLDSFLAKPQTMTETLSKDGNKIQVSAASETSIRGPHPGGDDQGGLLIIDEVAVIKDSLVDAAKGQLTSANPSACIQLSTMGERQTGRWHELVEDPNHKGYRMHRFDIFDVAKKCTYSCEACPVHDFANDVYQDVSGDEPPLIHRAYCAGKAHDTDGWISVDEIKMQWEELPRESFEREHMGINASLIGKVFDPTSIAACCIENVNTGKDAQSQRDNLLKMEKAIGHDWGWSNMSAACYVFRWRRALVVYRWELWDHVQFEKIGQHLVNVSYEERIESINADGSEPSSNDRMRDIADQRSDRLYRSTGEEFGCTVKGVAFSQWKSYGYGEIRRRMEQVDSNRPLLLFPKRVNGLPVANYEKAMAMLRSHKRKEDGTPAKIDDHPSDALMCAVLPFSRRWRSEPTVTGAR